MHPAALDPGDLLRHCTETRTRRGGPGGQHRNKVETAVILEHPPTGLSAEASERRSRAENRRVALARLRLRLALEHRTGSVPASPSALWLSRTRGRRLVIDPDHDDYPALIAEALDRLQADRSDTATAAHALGITSTQLVRLFKKVPEAWVTLGRIRAENGLPALK